MHILIMSWRDLHNPRAGGAERVTYEHARRWVAAGHRVTLFTSAYPGAAKTDDLEGINVVRRGSEKTVHVAAHHWYRRLGKRPDLVIDEIHGVPFCVLAYAQVPVVAWIYEVARHIWHRMYPFPVALIGRVSELALLRWYAVQHVQFVTDSVSTRMDLAALGVAPRNTIVIEPAIDLLPAEHVPVKASNPTMICVGRLVRMKGIEDAIEALGQVRREYPRARLWILGKGDEAYVLQLRRHACRLGLEGAVDFLGWVTEEEKRHRLASAHVLVHPSRREGWGINVLEANAAGTPAVGYRVPGLRDSIVDGVTGLLCATPEPTAMAESVCALLRSADYYGVIQRNALTWSSRRTWDVAAGRSLQLLHDVTARAIVRDAHTT